MQWGDLEHFLTLRGGTLKEEEAHWFLKQIFAAIRDYTKYKVIHRDLKLMNIAIVVDGENFGSTVLRDEYLKGIDFRKDRHKLKVKVIDFGFACKLSDDGIVNSLKLGSPFNRAPEITCPSES
jgi:serine/threonine protein kinase